MNDTDRLELLLDQAEIHIASLLDDRMHLGPRLFMAGAEPDHVDVRSFGPMPVPMLASAVRNEIGCWHPVASALAIRAAGVDGYPDDPLVQRASLGQLCACEIPPARLVEMVAFCGEVYPIAGPAGAPRHESVWRGRRVVRPAERGAAPIQLVTGHVPASLFHLVRPMYVPSLIQDYRAVWAARRN